MMESLHLFFLRKYSALSENDITDYQDELFKYQDADVMACYGYRYLCKSCINYRLEMNGSLCGFGGR